MYGLMTEASERNRYDQATARLDPPFAVVDLAAFDSNALDLVRRSGGLPIRVVSKSLRCRHLIERALARPGYRGIMSYSLAERLPEYHLISPDEPEALPVPTYRGDGQCFG